MKKERQKEEKIRVQSQKKLANIKTKPAVLIYAYGFDKIEFKWEQYGPFKVGKKAEIKFVRYLHDNCRLDVAKGVIIPSGVFKLFEDCANSSFGKVPKYIIEKHRLIQREHEIANILTSGGWVIFLMGEVIDKITWTLKKNAQFEYFKIFGWFEEENKDLCEIFLSRYKMDPIPLNFSTLDINIKQDEFKEYIQKWGASKTVLKLHSKDNQEHKILAEASGNIVGVEFQSQIFFLPFHTLDFTEDSLVKITKELTSAVCDYVQRRRVEVPEWTNKFKFENESKAEKELKKVISNRNILQKEISLWRGYKGILVQSGDILKNTIVGILRNFFGLKVNDIEELMEDATIENEKNEPIVFVEVKGTKSGIKRQHINQIDTNREKRNYDEHFPGLLIINNQMYVIGIEERLKTTVAKDVIRHAKANNVLILRTVDLLFLMRRFEGKSSEHRCKKFLEYCMQGGGRLKADNNSIKIINGTNS
ncbi:MAG: hypothetical protein ACETWC_06100 [Acidobacteriota bacterium]